MNPTCQKHPITIEKYDGSLKELATDIGNLRYDALADFIAHLAMKICHDGAKDTFAGRKLLGMKLGLTGVGLAEAEEYILHAWELCKPHMDIK